VWLSTFELTGLLFVLFLPTENLTTTLLDRFAVDTLTLPPPMILAGVARVPYLTFLLLMYFPTMVEMRQFYFYHKANKPHAGKTAYLPQIVNLSIDVFF
jgi:hypothetical protein